MRKQAAALLTVTVLTLTVFAITASRRTPRFGIECGSLGLPERQVLIRIPTDAAGLRVEITTATSLPRADGRQWTTLRARAGTDSLSCEASDPASFILDLSHASGPSVHLAIETDQPIALEARSLGDIPRGRMELGPTASGSFTW